jgi:hypothetical protein
VARITCKTPSTGKAILISLANVTTSFTTIAEAPDFSVPDPSQNYTARDPVDSTRAIRPGEIFFVTPLAVKNKSNNIVWIEVILKTEARADGTPSVDVNFGKVSIPPDDTLFFPIQGRSLFKRNPASTNGDRLQIRAQAPDTFDVWAAAEEKLSAEHIGVIP